ncbi:MAG: type II toxin-antitoxin system RelE family toxin, partial [Microcoleus sp.]
MDAIILPQPIADRMLHPKVKCFSCGSVNYYCVQIIRKPMRPNFLASWELRIGELRVYYDVEEEFEAIVEILAIGIKERNQV